MTTPNYFTRSTVSSGSFPGSPSVSFGFQANSFSLINEGTGTIQYSFDGTTVHGDLVPSTPSAGMVFKDRGSNMIWFKLGSGATSVCRIEAVEGSIEITGSGTGGGGGTTTVIVSPSTAASSSALEASHVLKASAGTFRSLYVMLDATAPSATYYVQLLTASATVPVDGAVTFLRPPQTIVHTMGTPDGVNFDEGDSGITFTVGCTACISSTQFTKTISGSYALFSGSVL